MCVIENVQDLHFFMYFWIIKLDKKHCIIDPLIYLFIYLFIYLLRFADILLFI